MESYSVSELVSALSYALDLTEGLPMGHALRSCMIGMRIAQAVGIPLSQQSELYYALLLKDSGCSSNASRLCHILGNDEIDAKRKTKTVDWTRVSFEQVRYLLSHAYAGQPLMERVRGLRKIVKNKSDTARELITIRCERGANIVRRMGLPDGTADAIHSLDEHWNGMGYPDGLQQQQIPILARILNLSQNLEVFHAQFGPDAAIKMALERSGRWFDPELVSAAVSLHWTRTLWRDFDDAHATARVIELEPEHLTLTADQATLDRICVAFADVIDAKSPFTLCHSTGVCQAAEAMAPYFDLTDMETKTLRRAALLHDIGKLGVPNSILEKSGKLTGPEWELVKRHPSYTHQILGKITGFEEISEIAASHHEKLDGSGYYRNLSGDQLPLASRILVVADIYDALAANRPYRAAIPPQKVLAMLKADAPNKLDATCIEALAGCIDYGLPEVAPDSYLLNIYAGIDTLAAAQMVY
jgi:putative nucleotidyltransferase with HDIG domain